VHLTYFILPAIPKLEQAHKKTKTIAEVNNREGKRKEQELIETLT